MPARRFQVEVCMETEGRYRVVRMGFPSRVEAYRWLCNAVELGLRGASYAIADESDLEGSATILDSDLVTELPQLDSWSWQPMLSNI